jgi:hypothetical protein
MTMIRPVAPDAAPHSHAETVQPAAVLAQAATAIAAAVDSTVVLAAGTLRGSAAETATAQLVVTASNDARLVGRSFPILGTSFVVGRDPAVDLPLSDDFCSRRHASIERREGAYVLVDTSSNGRLSTAARSTAARRRGCSSARRSGSATRRSRSRMSATPRCPTSRAS